IYALQDVEDDALAGIKSSALRLGGKVGLGVTAFYAAAIIAADAALWLAFDTAWATVAALPFGVHLVWQASRTGALAPLQLFRSNAVAGCLLAAGTAAAALAI
ncbi:MAG: 4-hydroxybenzoate octaprenyltransferase, partial [Pacificimonas sp.]